MLFLPYKIDRQLKSVPWVTIAIIAANVIVFVLEFALGYEGTILTLGFRPNAAGLLTWFTSMFLHADLLHIAGNMYFLWLFGSVVEDGIGRLRYLLLYVLGGLFSALLHGGIVMAFIPKEATIPMVGASGALAAVMGVFAVRYFKTDIKFFWWIYFRAGTLSLSSVWGVGLWGAREVLSGLLSIGGLSGGVANWAHVGGLSLGILGAIALGLGKEGETGYLVEEADSYAAAGITDIAAAKYREAAARPGGDADLEGRIARSKVELEAANGPDPAAVDDFRGVFEELVKADRRAEAASLAREMLAPLKRAGADPRLLMSVGGVAESQREWQLALEAYAAVAQTFQGTPEAEKAHFRVAHVLLYSERPQEACAYWQRFEAAYPASQWMAFADDRLRARAG